MLHSNDYWFFFIVRASTKKLPIAITLVTDQKYWITIFKHVPAYVY